MPNTFSTTTPSIKNIWEHTYLNKATKNRFSNFRRDVLPSKIKIIEVKSFDKDRTLKAEKKYRIESFSHPQYNPYLKTKGKDAKKQRKIRHKYDIVMELQDLTMSSKIKWRVGSLKKWQDHPAQNKVKTVYTESRTRFAKKYKKGSPEYKQAIAKIKKRGTYLDVGDYNSRVLGLNGDNYYRVQPLQYVYDCLYGRLWHKDLPQTPNLKYPFFGKHMIGVILYLRKKKILKS